MGASIIPPEIPPEVLKRIQSSGQLFGRFDWMGKKYVFCPNTNKGGVNPTHILELGRKIGEIAAEGKISLLKKVFLSHGTISYQGGETAVFIHQVAERWMRVRPNP